MRGEVGRWDYLTRLVNLENVVKTYLNTEVECLSVEIMELSLP